jgi:hypothetical protein
MLRAFCLLPRLQGLGPERRPLRFARVLHRDHEIFLALAFEFRLGRFELRNACCDFFPLLRQTFFSFGHCPSFSSDSCPTPISVLEWGVNGEMALQDCVLHTPEKNIASRARCSVDKADNVLSRAQLPDSEMKKGRARAAGLKSFAASGQFFAFTKFVQGVPSCRTNFGKRGD